MSSDTDLPAAPWEPEGTRNIAYARLFRAVYQYRNELAAQYRWVPVTAAKGTFTFGVQDRLLPVGALVRLWEYWPHLRGSCPECKDEILGYSFSGYLSAGGITGVCVGCGVVVSRWIGGMSRITSAIIPILENTPYYLRSGWGVRMEGPPVGLIAVLQELGASDVPGRDDAGFQTEVQEQPADEIDTREKKTRGRRKRRRSGAERRPRRFLVKEVVSTMAWTGTIWAVGCVSKESAQRALEKRVAKNIEEHGSPGAVMAYDRQIKALVLWSDEIEKPEIAVRYWFM
jgi:hypothetical protein